MPRTLILLESSIDPLTPSIQAMARILGPAHIYALSQPPALDPYQRVMICAGAEARNPVLNYVFDHLNEFSNRPTGLVLYSEESDPAWLGEVGPLIGCQAKQTALIPPSAPLNAFIDFAVSLGSQRRRPDVNVDEDRLQEIIEAYLKKHHLGVLSTVHLGRVHVSPIEYRYDQGHIYCLSQGGENFAGILNNGIATIGIFENGQKTPSHTALQCWGKARSPALQSEAYRRILEKWNLDPAQVKETPDPLYAIDISLEQALYTWPGFSEMGWEEQQVLRF